MNEPEAKTLSGVVALAGNGQFVCHARATDDDPAAWVVDVRSHSALDPVIRTLRSPAEFEGWARELAGRKEG